MEVRVFETILVIKSFNEMYKQYGDRVWKQYGGDYEQLEREYKKKREEAEKNKYKGSSNKFITHMVLILSFNILIRYFY